MKYMRDKSKESFIPNWFKFFFILGVFFWAVLILSFRPKQQPCKCQCEKPSVSVSTLQVTYEEAQK